MKLQEEEKGKGKKQGKRGKKRRRFPFRIV